jgi:hypothetical protein
MFVALLSSIASFLTLYVIHQLGKLNGYLILVYSMTVCQIIYDLSFFFFPGYKVRGVFSVIQVLTSFGGISVAIWTNVLSGVVLYISIFHRSIDIWTYYKYFFMLSVIPASIWAVSVIIVHDYELTDTINNYLRFLFILFNFVVYLIISVNLFRLGNDKIYEPLRELSRRFKYYPICQVVTRIPAVCFQYRYGYGTQDYGSPRSTAEVVAMISYCVTIPSAGIAYFFVFLYMQPQAWNEFLKLGFGCCTNRLASQASGSFKNYAPAAAEKSEASSVSSSEQYYFFTAKTDTSALLGKALMDTDTDGQDRLSDVCYSPLTESALNQYRNYDEDELCESMIRSQLESKIAPVATRPS